MNANSSPASSPINTANIITRSAPASNAPRPALHRHRRQCSICSHPQRLDIEEQFVRWTRPVLIATRFNVSESAIFRHALATGLFPQRRHNLRCVLELILERVEAAKVTGPVLLQAMRMYCHMTEDGQLLEPPRRSIVTYEHITSAPHSGPQPIHSPETPPPDHPQRPVPVAVQAPVPALPQSSPAPSPSQPLVPPPPMPAPDPDGDYPSLDAAQTPPPALTYAAAKFSPARPRPRTNSQAHLAEVGSRVEVAEKKPHRHLYPKSKTALSHSVEAM